MGITRHPNTFTERLPDGLAKDDAAVFRGVMRINVQIALGLQFDIDETVPRDLCEHMVQKSDPRRDRVRAGAVQVNACCDVGLARTTRELCRSAHGQLLLLQPPASAGVGLVMAEVLRPCKTADRRLIPTDPISTLAIGVREDQFSIMSYTMGSMNTDNAFPGWHATTIVTVRKAGRVVIAGDGQVSLGQTVIKANARKVRSLSKGDVISGFAGATADAFTLFERLEAKLEQYPGQLTRACVEMAKDWRTDRYLRRLEAMMIVADQADTLVLTGTGDVLEPEDHCTAIGSGGNFALAAARALLESEHSAEEIARRAMKIAADICVYTNDNLVLESLDSTR